jgi:hypothetical protein
MRSSATIENPCLIGVSSVANEPQLDLPLCAADRETVDPQKLMDALADNCWHTATDILRSWGLPNNEAEKRSIRAMCAASKGQVTGGQHGYKLTRALTPEEFHAVRNEKLKSRDALTQSVVDLDTVFYGRKPI